jgi:diguanylate cyclase
MKILVVDDDKLDRMIVKRNLNIAKSEFELVEINTAEKALKRLREEFFDLVLLDYNLPDKDGIEVLKTIKNEIDQDIAVVMFSHLDNEKLAYECIKLGAQDFLKKKDVTASRLKQTLIFAKERDKKEQDLIHNYHHILKIAEHDSLTGLANRYFFEESIQKALLQAKRDNNNLAVVMIDLDHFKDVNDTLGHAAGDELLKSVATRLKKTARECDVLCRLGGDEFVALIPHLEDEVYIHRFIDRLYSAFKKPVSYNDSSIIVSTSIGVALYPLNADNSADLLKCADIALYRSKEAGRNQSQFYSEQLHKKIKLKIALDNEIKAAIENNEFVLHYQPIFESRGKDLIGIEAFVRWKKPDGSLIFACDFMHLVESLGLVDQMGDWVITAICSQLSQWKSKYMSRLNLSISAKISSSQLDNRLLIDRLKSAFALYNIGPDELQLELLERTFNEANGTLDLLDQMQKIGVSLVLDKFGCDCTSFKKLPSYPIHLVKIDRSFVQALETTKDCLIVDAMCDLVKKLNFKVALKGIETQTQYDLCKHLNFDQMQGNYFGEPLEAEAFEATWIQNKLK